MAIEETYRSLLGAQRQRQKKEERQDMLLQAGTLATNIYQQKLDEKAQEFFDRTEVADQRIKYQEGYDLYNNKIKKIYDEGTQSTLGLGEYLVGNIAQPIAQERIYANFDEDMVSDPDELGSAVRSYAEEMVYGGLDAQGNRIGGGMLDKLQAAYDSGKTLKSMGKYDEYISRRADLPENVGMALVGRFFNGKSRQEVEADALQRIATNNQFDENSAAFRTLAKAFDSGMSLTNSEEVAKKVQAYTENIKMKADEFLKDSKIITAKRPDGKGGQFEYTYIQDTYEDIRTGAVRTVDRANTSDPFSTRIFDNEQVTLPGETVEGEEIDSLTGKIVKTQERTYTTVSGKDMFKDIEVNTVGENPLRGDITTEVSDTLIDAANQTVNGVILQQPDAPIVRDAFAAHQERLYGEDEEQKKQYRTDVNRNVHIMGYNLSQEYGFDLPTGRKIAAQVLVNDVRYNEETGGEFKNYRGANLYSSTESNGLRILEAINDLNMSDAEFRLGGIADEKEFVERLIPDLISKNNLTAFRGRKGASTREDVIFDDESRRYFLSKNMPQDANINNYFNLPINLGVPYADAGLTLYDYIERETMGTISRGQNLKEYYGELTEAEELARIQATLGGAR